MNEEPERNEPEAERPVREAVDRAREAAERARPQVERLVKDATPKVQKAARDAYDYARAHDEELKGVAKALLWARLRGPWRLALGAFEGGSSDRRRSAATSCPSCGTAAATTAKFCTECGARLTDEG